MTSQIIFSTIDTTYPIPGRDNDSQGFRNNFSVVKAGLEIAYDEISLLQANKADLVNQSSFTNETDSESTITGAMTVLGGVGVGKNLNVGGSITSGGASVSNTATLAFSLVNSDLIVHALTISTLIVFSMDVKDSNGIEILILKMNS
jgi:hypothetical protein